MSLGLNLKRYDPAITPTLCGHLSARGLTDAQIAELIRVPEGTFKRWRHEHAELKDAMQPGKDLIDSLVEGSLLKRAFGYNVEEVTREKVEVGKKKNGEPRFKTVVSKRVTKHVASDVVACIFWLKNRKPVSWKDRNHLVISKERPFEQMSDGELQQIAIGAGNGNGAGTN